MTTTPITTDLATARTFRETYATWTTGDRSVLTVDELHALSRHFSFTRDFASRNDVGREFTRRGIDPGA